MKLSFFRNKRDSVPTQREIAWDKFCERLARPDIRANKDGGLFAPAVFVPAKRGKANVTELSCLVLDYDHNADLQRDTAHWRAMGVAFALYTTHSHQRVTESHLTPEDCFRVVLPLATPIPVDQFPALWRWAEELTNRKIDKAAKDPSRIYYLPSKASNDAPYFFECVAGELLDWQALDLQAEQAATPRQTPQPTAQNTYALAALRDEVARVAMAENGSRNNQLFRSACALGQFVGAGAFTAHEVADALARAAQGAGVPANEARQTIASGLQTGQREPRVLPEPKQGRAPKAGEPPEAEAAKDATQKEPKRSQADQLIEVAQRAKYFLCVEEDEAYASVMIGEHQETYRVNSKPFRQYLSRIYWQETGKVPNGEALQNAISHLAGQARFEGEQLPVFLRLAAHEGRIYWDLCNREWQIVEMSDTGWRVIEAKDAPVRFRRTRGMLPLPIPTSGGKLDKLRDFVNYPDAAAWVLHCAWLVAALRANGRTFPVLIINGEQGSAKSTACKITRRLIDPNTADLRPKPREDRDLYIAANNSWVCAFDNLSGIGQDLSDSICRIATGAGFGGRELFSDADETLFQVARPTMLNGIDDLASKADLVDRGVFIQLPPIPEEERRDEETLWRAFDEAQPALTGALADAVVTALRDLPKVKLDKLPRMADFAKWGAAANIGGAGVFIEAYTGNRTKANQDALLANDLAECLIEWLGSDEEECTIDMTTLLAQLSTICRDRLAKLLGGEPKKQRLPDRWPKMERELTNELRRCAPNLRRAGIEVKEAKSHPTTRRTQRTFKRVAHPNEGVNHPSHPSHLSENLQNQVNQQFAPEGYPEGYPEGCPVHPSESEPLEGYRRISEGCDPLSFGVSFAAKDLKTKTLAASAKGAKDAKDDLHLHSGEQKVRVRL